MCEEVFEHRLNLFFAEEPIVDSGQVEVLAGYCTCIGVFHLGDRALLLREIGIVKAGIHDFFGRFVAQREVDEPSIAQRLCQTIGKGRLARRKVVEAIDLRFTRSCRWKRRETQEDRIEVVEDDKMIVVDARM